MCIRDRRIYANPKVRADAGCVALARGPIVYCMEEADNGENLAALRLPRDSGVYVSVGKDKRIGDVPVLEAQGIRLRSDDALYSGKPPVEEEVSLTAVPYYTWGNRGAGGMRVWIHE